MNRIYVFGDRGTLVDNCRYSLGRLGYVVYTPPQAMAFLETVYAQPPDLAIIDLVADGPAGLKLCRQLRGDPRFQLLPILVVATPALLGGVQPDQGFDDLLVEPFGPEEVEVRVRMVQWRLRSIAGDDTLRIGPLRLDLAAYQAYCDDQPMELTRLEFELLRFLATHRGVAYTREMLLSLVWGEHYYGGTRTVDVHVRRLRAKMGEHNDELIQTVRGIGYRFTDSA